jgi:pilus assembly protein CpaE
MKETTIVVTELLPGAAAGLLEALSGHGEFRVLGYAGDGLEAAQMAVQHHPDVVLVHADMPGVSGPDVAAILSQAAPGVACALLADQESPDLLRRAMASGARAILTPGMTGASIAATLHGLAETTDIRRQSIYARATDPVKAPVVVAVGGVVGGAGRTSLSVNLATALARMGEKEAALIEVSLDAARAALLLNLRPKASLADLLESHPDGPDDAFESYLTEHQSGLKLLAGQSNRSTALLDDLTPRFMAALRAAVRRRYLVSVFHLPCALWSGGLYVLRRADHVLVVTPATDALCLHDTANYISSITESGVPRGNITLVINKSQRSDPIASPRFAETCGIERVVELPLDAKTMSDCLRSMTPAVVSAPSSPLARALVGLATQVLEPRITRAAA